MTRCKWFLHDNRAFEVRDRRVFTSFQIWIYEAERPVALHSEVPLRDASQGLIAGIDLLGQAMEAAIADVQNGRFALCLPPVVLAAE
jgi:hypothetical protein